jgi:pimeloyl-ACP methyl ester carboxylesterase
MGSSNPLDTARYSGGALARDFLALVDSLSLRDDALVGYSMGADWSVLMACGTLWLQAALARSNGGRARGDQVFVLVDEAWVALSNEYGPVCGRSPDDQFTAPFGRSRFDRPWRHFCRRHLRHPGGHCLSLRQPHRPDPDVGAPGSGGPRRLPSGDRTPRRRGRASMPGLLRAARSSRSTFLSTCVIGSVGTEPQQMFPDGPGCRLLSPAASAASTVPRWVHCSRTMAR